MASVQAYPIMNLSGDTNSAPLTASLNGAAYLSVGGLLYRSTGTESDTASVRPGLVGMAEWDGALYEGLNSNLWRVDPVSLVTTEIKDAEGGLSLGGATNFVPVGDKLYFAANSQDIRRQGMFVLDRGSAEARYLGPGRPLGAANGKLLYIVTEQVPGSYRWSLWRTDGVSADKLKDDFYSVQSVSLNDSTLLIDGPGGLWKSDGTADGTVLLKPDAGGLREWLRVGDAVYYINAVTARPSGLWKTDGTADGTVLLRESVLSGANLSPPNGPSLAHVGDTVYFVAYPGSGATQLYATEGPGTTRQLTHLDGVPDGEGVAPVLAAVDGKVFFSARVDNRNFELWQTDGTPDNMTRVPGYVISDGGSFDYGPLNLTASGGSLYFTQRLYNGPTRLWRYGVTPAAVDADGTLVVNGTDPAEGVGGNDAVALSAVGDAITASINGESFSFPAASVRRIAVNALGGDDALEVDEAVRHPLTFNASSGKESVTLDGTAGDDQIVVGPHQVLIGARQFAFTGLDHLTVRGLEGNDRIAVDGTPADDVRVEAGGGDDAVEVWTVAHDNTGGLASRLSLLGGAGTNTLTLNDSTRSDPQAYDLAEFSLRLNRGGAGGQPLPPIDFVDFDGGVTLKAGRGADVVRVTPGGKVGLFVDGGAPAGGATAGDALVIVPGGATGARLESSQVPGAGRYAFDNRRPVSFADVEVPDNLRPPAATGGRIEFPGISWRIPVEFDEPVVVPANAGAALRLEDLSTGTTVPADLVTAAAGGGSEIVFTVPGFLAPGGQYRATVPAGSVADFAGNVTQSDFVFEFEVAPRITGFWAGGSTWPQSFRDRLDRTGGKFRPGWLIDPSPQFWLVPWAGIDRVVARFDSPVDVDAADLDVRGVNTPNYVVSDFAYDPNTFTATWSLSRPFDVDKVLFVLDGHSATGVRGTGPGVAPGTGPLMDGENQRAGAHGYPTGDGVPGGDFRGRLDVLVGNALSDNTVNALDLSTIRQRLNAVPPPPGQGGGLYRVDYDIVPDGRINALDLASVRRHLNRSLPAGDPGPLFPPAPALVPVARELFGAKPIL